MAALAVRGMAGAGQRWRKTNALLAGAILCLALQFYAPVYAVGNVRARQGVHVLAVVSYRSNRRAA